MHWLKEIGIRGVDRSRLSGLSMRPQERRLRTLMFHRLRSPETTVPAARERLRRWCDWLRQTFHVIDADSFLRSLADFSFPENSLLITVDDARRDILSSIDVFAEFEIRPTLFVATGWIDGVSEPWDEPSLCQVITALENRERTPALLSRHGGGTTGGSPVDWSDFADRLVRDSRCAESVTAQIEPCLEEAIQYFASQRDEFCHWEEIDDLVSAGVTIGSHTVSHCRLAGLSCQWAR